MLTTQISDLIAKSGSQGQIYRDLMQFRIREILLVTTYYDAYILEQEDRLSEQIFGEYHDLNLTNAPRITNASTGEETLKLLNERRFDLVILTMRISDFSPFDLSDRIKQIDPRIPIILLLHDNNDLIRLGDNRSTPNIEKIFVWNRDSNIFLAMINYIEDKMNAENDAKIGLVRIILLVENSVRYYSRYLPELYHEIIMQTQHLIEEEYLDDMIKVLRINARPKILMAVNYEEALKLYEKYKDNLLCVISDVRFPKDGKISERAGIDLIEFVRESYPDLPCIIQSSETENKDYAKALNAFFIDKNSETTEADLKEYINNNLGFGDFIFKDDVQKELARASNMHEMKESLKKISDESLDFHSKRNHFSAWLMARGEIEIARNLQPVKVSDFRLPQDIRNYLIDVFDRLDDQHIRGKVIDFDEAVLERDSFIVRLADGSLGGKGRGLAFINSIISKVDIEAEFKDVKISVPRTGIIGTGEYERFISENNLSDVITSDADYEEIKKRFVKGKLSHELKKNLKLVLEHFHRPVAVRSSGLFEDSISDSFSGVYETFLLPNNHKDDKVRLEHLEDAIKLVFASVFSPGSRAYFDAIDYSVEEEKMAVLIQEVAGNLYSTRYYPDISGVAQSYNYYPISYMKPEEGIAVVGLGLGKYVIDGEKAYRFCPKYPKLEISTPEMLLTGSQDFFYAVNMNEDRIDLIKGDEVTLSTNPIETAETDGRLGYIASVWDPQNQIIKAGINSPGPRIINFAYVLKYNTFPLAGIIDNILEILKFAMGTPVEIEFAANFDDGVNEQAVFYILQIKPLIREMQNLEITIRDTEKDKLILFTDKGMGNGIIEDLQDIVYCGPEKFDKTKTMEMAKEVEEINKIMTREGRKYVLIGSGRWGTRDRWLGIPVVWTQISNARIIVEAGMKDFHIDASLGSHFFHNVTSMNIGYFTVGYNSQKSFIDWQWLAKQKKTWHGNFFVRISLPKPVKVMMDGRHGISVIYKPE
jgi:CheY-like chemotaxis protein